MARLFVIAQRLSMRVTRSDAAIGSSAGSSTFAKASSPIESTPLASRAPRITSDRALSASPMSRAIPPP